MERNIHILKGKSPSHSKILDILQQFRLYCNEKTPKGFEKFFKPGGKSSAEAPKSEAKPGSQQSSGAPKSSKEAHKEAPKESPKENPFGGQEKKFQLKYEFKFGSSGGK